MIHVRHQFHPVGHGTFFTGLVTADNDQKFSWVYDCGSKWPASIKYSLSALDAWKEWSDKNIDLLAISHFDHDHINGLELLLESKYVKWLVIPYLNFKDRLEQASAVLDESEATPDTAVFALDPLGFLASRGLSKKIGHVLVVSNDGDGTVNDGFSPLPSPDSQLERRSDGTGFGQTELKLFRYNRRQQPPIIKWRHDTAIGNAELGFEILFYNSALEADVAPISGRSLKYISKDAKAILSDYRVIGGPNPPVKGWQKALRSLYDRHFGKSGVRRNAISLCALFRPIGEDFSKCNVFSPFPPSQGVTQDNLRVRNDGNALLLTGDLSLDAANIGTMEKHFGKWRWQQLSAVQVPHHGSRHSWATGNAKLFPNPNFIQCIPTDRSKNHPHKDVVSDLAHHSVVFANYERSVATQFHYKYQPDLAEPQPDELLI